MVKKKTAWCRECGKRTPHAYVGKETMTEGMFLPARALFAVFSLGMSEKTSSTHWQCERCGNIREE